jgi:hypothetical protein
VPEPLAVSTNSCYRVEELNRLSLGKQIMQVEDADRESEFSGTLNKKPNEKDWRTNSARVSKSDNEATSACRLLLSITEWLLVQPVNKAGKTFKPVAAAFSLHKHLTSTYCETR